MNVNFVIGRFQPLHREHEHLIREAYKEADLLIIFIGSSNSPRSYKNPFTALERAQLIKEAFPQSNIITCSLPDYENNSDWLYAIRDELFKLGGLNNNYTFYHNGKDKETVNNNLLVIDKFSDFNNKEVISNSPELEATNIRRSL